MIIILNNKANLGKSEFSSYLSQLLELDTKQNLVLCPSFINIANAKNNKFAIGSQDVSFEDNGAYTGEVTAKQLKSYGVQYAIIGHSERRKFQRESLEDIKEKVEKALSEDIIPILCVGEKQEEKEFAKTIIAKQIESAIVNLNQQQLEKLIIAYEPVWSIGTGNIPGSKELSQITDYIKELFPDVKVVYGGSLSPENIHDYLKIKTIDGYLLGGLSLKVDELAQFLKNISSEK